MGTQINQNKYAKQNTFTSLELYPINRRKYEGQDATFVMLAAKRGRFDPLCVVDMSLTQPKEVSKEPNRARTAATLTLNFFFPSQWMMEAAMDPAWPTTEIEPTPSMATPRERAELHG